MPEQDSCERTERTGWPEHESKDKTIVMEQPCQGSWVGISGQDRTARTDQFGRTSLDGTERFGLPGHDKKTGQPH